MNTPTTDRFYPIACRSASCGEIECAGCPNAAKLNEFKAWKTRTNAYQPDHIWSPSLWREGPRKG